MKMRAAVFIILAVAFTALIESSPAQGDKRFPLPIADRSPPARYRFRRSPEPQPGPQLGSLSATWWRDLSSSELRPFYNVRDYDHGIFEDRFRRSAENESSEFEPESPESPESSELETV